MTYCVGKEALKPAIGFWDLESIKHAYYIKQPRGIHIAMQYNLLI